jgi:hypothetical protein
MQKNKNHRRLNRKNGTDLIFKTFKKIIHFVTLSLKNCVQASATACVQNVMRSLNMNGLEKEQLTAIIPSHLLSQVSPA